MREQEKREKEGHVIKKEKGNGGEGIENKGKIIIRNVS